MEIGTERVSKEIPVDEFLGDADKMNNSGTSRRDF